MSYPVGSSSSSRYSGAGASFPRITEEQVRDCFYNQMALAKLLNKLGESREDQEAAIQLGVLNTIDEGRDAKGGYSIDETGTRILNKDNCPEIYKKLLPAMNALEGELLFILRADYKTYELEKLKAVILKTKDLSAFPESEKPAISKILHILTMISQEIQERDTFAGNAAIVKAFASKDPYEKASSSSSSSSFPSSSSSSSSSAAARTAAAVPLKDKKIDGNDLQNTFRRLVANEIINEITADSDEAFAFVDQDSFIYVGYTGLALINWILNKDTSQNGYNLIGHKILKEDNCPKEYSLLFKLVEPLYKKLVELKHDPKNIDYIRLKVLNSESEGKTSELDRIEKGLSKDKITNLNRIVAALRTLATPITQIKTFAEGFGKVVEGLVRADLLARGVDLKDFE